MNRARLAALITEHWTPEELRLLIRCQPWGEPLLRDVVFSRERVGATLAEALDQDAHRELALDVLARTRPALAPTLRSLQETPAEGPEPEPGKAVLPRESAWLPPSERLARSRDDRVVLPVQSGWVGEAPRERRPPPAARPTPKAGPTVSPPASPIPILVGNRSPNKQNPDIRRAILLVSVLGVLALLWVGRLAFVSLEGAMMQRVPVEAEP